MIPQQEEMKMRLTWRDYSDRKWTPNNEMKKFEELLIENGFIIQKVRESCSKTEYMAVKDNIQDIFVFNATDKAKDRIKFSLRSHDILVENMKLKQEMAKRNLKE